VTQEDAIVDREELAGVVRAAFGPARRLADVQRLRGGSKKGVYRLTLDNGSTVVGDFPDREPMMRIVAFNVEQALAFAGP